MPLISHETFQPIISEFIIHMYVYLISVCNQIKNFFSYKFFYIIINISSFISNSHKYIFNQTIKQILTNIYVQFKYIYFKYIQLKSKHLKHLNKTYI